MFFFSLIKLADNNQSEILLNLKHKESIALTVSDEQLSATHLPAIAEPIAKRRQEFSVKVNRLDFESSLFKYLNCLDRSRCD